MKAPMFVRQLFAALALSTLLTPAALAQSLTGTANFTSKLQQIDGFGVAATFGRPAYIQSASGNLPSQIVDQLFNPVTGSGINMLRIGIDDQLVIVNTPPVSCQVTPTYTWDHSDGGAVWLGQQSVKYGVKRFYADSWSAPAYMKTNNTIESGGTICDGSSATSGSAQCQVVGDCRAAYSNYLLQYTKDFLSDGVPITDLGWVNEPNTNTSSYASMVPTTAETINFMDVYGPIVRSSGLNLNITCCDVFDWTTANNYDTAVINDPTASSFVDIYTAHEYGQVAKFVLNTGTPTKKNWMSEWGPQSPVAWNPLWDNPYVGTSRNFADGMMIANDISNALNLGQVSAYLYWYADSTSTTGAMIQMGASSGATSYVVPARLYALTHFSRFVHPGAYQVSMSTSSPACTTITQGVGNCLVTTAFVNPDGSKVINVVNNYTSAESLSLTLDAGTSNWVPSAYVTDVTTIPDSTYPATTSTTGTFPPAATNTAVALTNGVTTVGGTALTATFTPRSMTTIVLTPPVMAGTVQLVVTPSRFAEGDGTVLDTLTITNNGTGTAQNVQLTSATLGTSVGTTMPTGPLPFSIGNIAPGSSEVVSVNYAAGQTPASMTIEKIAGTYTSSSGSGNFGASFRAVVPVIPAQP